MAAIPMRNARRACSSHVAIGRLAWIWRACLMTRFGGGKLVELGDELLGPQEAHAAQCLRIQRLLIQEVETLWRAPHPKQNLTFPGSSISQRGQRNASRTALGAELRPDRLS